GGVFSIGSTVVSWYSRKQRSVALSSAEAEYMAASLAACEAIWMRKILVGLFGSLLDPTVIYCDNQSCIKLSANPVFHDRSKHIDIRYHHIRDCVQRRIMLLSYIPMEDLDADILMKALTRRKFEYNRGRIGVADNPYLVEREC
ncbi:Ty1/Copia family ribonuclease HI, partial [Actinobacillus pleuropneumoniae]|uniref:Ty1/Copia family ribonuclease HI n=1 Tax=Actinobacillus pleuropneumoniae TaxID=715 RepID=UPI00227CAB97